MAKIEMDALQKNPQQFKGLVVNAIDRYYDKSIHEANLKKFTARKITNFVNKKIKFLK